jgi:hypothetical protein
MGYKNTVIVPIVGLVALVIKYVTGVDFDQAVQQQVTDVLTNALIVGSLIYGVFKNHK